MNIIEFPALAFTGGGDPPNLHTEVNCAYSIDMSEAATLNVFLPEFADDGDRVMIANAYTTAMGALGYPSIYTKGGQQIRYISATAGGLPNIGDGTPLVINTHIDLPLDSWLTFEFCAAQGHWLAYK